MRLDLALTLLLATGPAFAEDCPAPPDNLAERAEVLAAIRAAPDEGSARVLTNRLWALWSAAPDGKAQALLDRGKERRAAYDFDAAREALDALVAYCPDYAEGWNQRAFVAFLRGDFATSLEDLDRAIELAPDHVAAMSGKALSLMSLGRHGRRTRRSP